LQNFDCEEYNEITIDTVERFQGSERDVIIYGFTIQRAYQLSFLTSNVILENNQLIDRKLNVALTRAREQLFVVSNVDLLSQFPLFKQLVDDYESKGLLFDSNDLEF
jgi:superfamily I DNA and/or RNA helicase